MSAQSSSLRAFAAIACGYWTAPGYRAIAWSLTAGMVLFGAINVGIALWLNIWNRDFFNALEKRDTSQLVGQLYILAAIVVSGGIAVAIHLHIRRRLQINWRTWLTQVTTRRWLHAGRQYQLGLLAGDCDNPDGRIAEDIRVSCELAVEFAQSILQCILQLITFLSVLWVLSGALPVKIGSVEFSLPGYMVWAAVLYALFGSILTYALGSGLIEAGNVRQGREADVRSVLIRARENAEGIALMRGEPDERARLHNAMTDLGNAWHTQTRGQGSLALLTSSLAYVAPVVPLILALPRYLAGDLQLGGLMQTAQAFSNVQWALSWVIDNFPRFADWRASTDRVVQLHSALLDLEESTEARDGEHIEVTAGESDRLILREVGLSRPDGEALVAEAEVEIKPGERVLIRGQSGSGKSTIMRAIAGVWPWGRGAVELPKASLAFMPQKPYFPLGTLRDALLYPARPDDVQDEDLREALHRVGLDHLRGRLDETERWDHILSGGEQQRVAFARVLIQKPDWVFMDESTSALDEAGQANVMRLLAEELPRTAVVSIGHRPGLEAFHTRELVLEPGNQGAALKARPGRRNLREIYRRMAAASRADTAGPGFWPSFRQSMLGR
ncbi:MAG: ABC transporter ATP-binding protein/permease [Reyranellaceae bacterium]